MLLFLFSMKTIAAFHEACLLSTHMFSRRNQKIVQLNTFHFVVKWIALHNYFITVVCGEGLLCVSFVLWVIMVIMGGHWIPPYALSSTWFWYGIIESGAVSWEFVCIILCFYVYTWGSLLSLIVQIWTAVLLPYGICAMLLCICKIGKPLINKPYLFLFPDKDQCHLNTN